MVHNTEGGTHENLTFDMSEVNGIPSDLELKEKHGCIPEGSSASVTTASHLVLVDPKLVKGCQQDSSTYISIFNAHRHIPMLKPYAHIFSVRNQKRLFGIIALVLYLVYFFAVLQIRSEIERENYWCNQDGFLIICTTIFGVLLLYFKGLKPFCKTHLHAQLKPLFKFWRKFNSNRKVKVVIYCAVAVLFAIFLVIDAWEDQIRLVSAFGALSLVLLGALFSLYPTQIDIEQIIWGLGLQVTLGLLIMRWPVGRSVFKCLGGKVTTFLSYNDIGSIFTFGEFLNHTNSYVFKILTVILYFGFFVSILYHYGIMQQIIIKLGWLFEISMGTTPCESMAVSANIFLGQSEAPLVIRPYISKLTKSELHSVATGGFATVAGGILAAYISFGVEASHLLSASLMSAPAALAMSKLFYPEIEESCTKKEQVKLYSPKSKNVLLTIMNDLIANIPLIANISACLLVFISFGAFCNSVADWSCQLLNYEKGHCSVQSFLAYLMYPFAWLMGVPKDDCYFVGYLLGTKLFITEFLAYKELGERFQAGLISNRGTAVATYALCGFSSLASIGCQIGAIGYLAPTRIEDITAIIVRSFVAGNFACFLTACIAGMFIQDADLAVSNLNATLTYH